MLQNISHDYFDERDISRKYDVSIENNVFSWERITPEFSQCMTITISDDGNTLVGTGTMQKDGGAWENDIQFTGQRTM